MTERRMLVRVALAALATAGLALAGATVASGGKQAPARPTAADTLVVGVPDDAATFDPVFGGTPRSTEVILNTYDTYTTYALKPASNGVRIYDAHKPVGLLFQSMQASANGRSWTLTLRQGMKFPDGTPIDASTLMYAIDRNFGVKAGGGGFLWHLIGRIAGPQAAKQTGKYTVRLTTQGPNALLPYLFALSNSVLFNPGVVKQHAAKGDEWATKWLARNPAGVGPYTLDRWTPGSEIVLKADPSYWGGVPSITTVDIKEIPSSANRLLLLQRGNLDLVERLSQDEIQSLSGKSGVKVISVPSSGALTLIMNVHTKPFDNVLVRRAISYAVPYADIINQVYHGRARPTAGPVPVDFPNHLQAGYPYGKQNVAKAKALLAQAGLASGFSTDLDLDSGSPEHEAVAVLVQNALKQVGVTANIKKLTPAQFSEQRQKKQLGFFFNDTIWWVADPAYAVGLGYVCNSFFGYGDYCNAKVDAAMKQASFEANKAKRTAEFNALQRQIWADAPMVWIAQPNFNLAVRTNVTGYSHFIDEMVRFKYLKKS
jgi:peptide/nickel transport system substrate-binding protein